jgi:hypothetical protein
VTRLVGLPAGCGTLWWQRVWFAKSFRLRIKPRVPPFPS